MNLLELLGQLLHLLGVVSDEASERIECPSFAGARGKEMNLPDFIVNEVETGRLVVVEKK
jgi:hypothetical protein